MVLATAISQTVNVYPVSFDPTDAVRMGMTALPNAAADAAGGLPISDAGGLDMDALNTAAVRLTAARAQAIDDWINGGRLDLLLDAIKVVTDAQTAITPAALVDLVWDELLTGAAHNTATSAGRRLRALNDFGQYEGGAVWYDDVNGTAGAVDYENGTVQVPTTEEASVTTLMASLGYTIIHCVPGSTYVLEAAYLNKLFIGENWTLDLNGQSVIGCVFVGATVSGVAAGVGTTQKFINCIVGATSIIKGTHFLGCGLSGNHTLVEAGDVYYDNCRSAVAGTGSVTFDFGAALNSSSLNVRHHSGGWTVENMGAGTGTYNASFEGDGQIVWAASCSATSNASIRGSWKITDNASGAVTETLDDNQTSVDAILVDTGATIPGLIGTPAGADLVADVASVITRGNLAWISGPTASAAFSDISVLLVLAADHVTPATGVTPTLTISIDGASFGAKDAGSSVAEIAGTGMFQVDLHANDMAGAVITGKLSEGTADDAFFTIMTSPA